MKLLLEQWREYIKEGLNFLPDDVLQGEEDEGPTGEGVLVKNIPMTSLSMLDSQGVQIITDIWRDELSMTDGLPVLFYNSNEQQLIVDDGNHRIFQKWLQGEDYFDAYVYSGEWHNTLRHVYSDEVKFDWDEEYRA